MTLTVRATVASRGVDLAIDIPTGQTTAVLGPNGAGKSTLLGLAAGLVRPDRGTVALDGDELAGSGGSIPPHRRRIALLDQRASLFPHLDVLGNVAFGARAQAGSRGLARERARRWLAEVGALDLAAARSDAVSGGQAQRIALARALAAEPRLVLLDEPLSSLDVGVAREIRRTLRRTLEGRSALLVTHDVLDVWGLAHGVVVIEDGRVTDSGPVDEVMRRPRSAFVAELTGLGMLHGVRSAAGVRLSDGRELPARAPGIAEGTEVVATVGPRAVRVVGEGGTRARVIALERRGDVLRIRTDLLPVDVDPSDAGEVDEGAMVRIAVDPDALTLRSFDPRDP